MFKILELITVQGIRDNTRWCLIFNVSMKKGNEKGNIFSIYLCSPRKYSVGSLRFNYYALLASFILMFQTTQLN